MVRIFRSERLVFQTGFFIILSLSLLIIPFRWVVGWVTAVFFHEFCHYIALRLYRIPVLMITVRAFGADMQTGPMTPWQECVCALSGPLGSLLLLFFLRLFPYVSLCAFVQSIFNLIPTYPMDGGRVLKCICVGLMGEGRGVRFSRAISLIFSIFLISFFLLISLQYQLGVMPMLVAVLIIIRTIKIPCKERKVIVQ